MDYKVYDRDGNELTGQNAADLVAHHGLSVSPPPDLQEGERYYKLVALRDKTGAAAFIYRVLDADGKPVFNPDEKIDRTKTHRAWWWPTVCEANDIQTPYPTDRYECADLGGLNTNGEGGSGMDAFHDPDKPGPYQAWVRHPMLKSDLLVGIGMVGMTNHDHMDGEWQEVVYGDGGPTPPDGELKPEYLETVEQLDSATVMFGMAIILDSDAAEEWVWDTRALLTGPGVHDIVNPFAWTYPTTGEPCSVATGCCDYGSDDPNEERQYSVSLIRLKPGGYDTLIGPRSLMVKPLGVEEKRLVVRVYRLVGEGPTPPPPDGHAAKLRGVADALDVQSAVVREVADAVNSGGLSGLVLRFEDGSEREVEL